MQQDKQLGEAEGGGSGSNEIEETEEGSEAYIEDGIWRQDIFSTLQLDEVTKMTTFHKEDTSIKNNA